MNLEQIWHTLSPQEQQDVAIAMQGENDALSAMGLAGRQEIVKTASDLTQNPLYVEAYNATIDAYAPELQKQASAQLEVIANKAEAFAGTIFNSLFPANMQKVASEFEMEIKKRNGI